jgi:signal transduction histidine kinase
MSQAAQIAEEYGETLKRYLGGGGEADLLRAYDLGRKAVADGLGVLDLVALHGEAVETMLQGAAFRRQGLRTIREARAFLAESLAPFEMTHRSFKEANAALRFVNDLLEGQARRIAHALHDEAGQLLASVHLALESAARDLPARDARGVRQIRKILDQIENELRRLSHELRPTVLDDLGLLPALRYLAKGVSTRTGIPVTVEGPEGRSLPPPIETALYRIVQEAVSNAARHGRSHGIEVRIKRENGTVRCTVQDDGRGFDVADALSRGGERGLGLVGIRERASAFGGVLEIQSAPARGTKLVITIPLEVGDGDTNIAGG